MKLVNYQQLANYFDPQDFIFQNTTEKLVTFYQNKQRNFLIANLHYQNINYMIGPVVITDFIWGGRDVTVLTSPFWSVIHT